VPAIRRMMRSASREPDGTRESNVLRLRAAPGSIRRLMKSGAETGRNLRGVAVQEPNAAAGQCLSGAARADVRQGCPCQTGPSASRRHTDVHCAHPGPPKDPRRIGGRGFGRRRWRYIRRFKPTAHEFATRGARQIAIKRQFRDGSDASHSQLNLLAFRSRFTLFNMSDRVLPAQVDTRSAVGCCRIRDRPPH